MPTVRRSATIAAALLCVSTAAHAQTWRDEANARIEQHRKADLTVKVVDAAGNAVEGATVDVRMQRHAFEFGTAVNETLWASTSNPNNAKYRNEITRLFNAAVLENGHKWSTWEDPVRRARADLATDDLLGRGLAVRGHTMMWQRWQNMPTDVYDNRTNTTYVRQRALDHIETIGTHYGDKLHEWDVLNEQWSEHVLTDLLDPGVAKERAPTLASWFNAARAASPGARLYVNDYGILESGNQTNTSHQQSYYDTIDGLRDAGAPIGGIGFQGHFGSANAITQPTNLLRILDRFAEFDVPLKVTEFDMYGSGWTEQSKADYLRDFLTAVFSHEAVDGFLMWGFWDGAHWMSSAPLFDANWNLKPSGQAFMDLVFDAWWTEVAGATGDAGAFATRGFLGDYAIDVTHGGVTRSFDLSLDSGGGTLVVTVPEPAAATLVLASICVLTRRSRR